MTEQQPCHAKAENAKHRFAMSARDYFFAGDLRSWNINDNNWCYCIEKYQINCNKKAIPVGSNEFCKKCDSKK